MRLITSTPPRAERPLVRLVTIPIPGRPAPLYAVQKRLEHGPRWLQQFLPYWSLSGMHSEPRYACAEAFGRCMAQNDFELAQAVLALGRESGSGFDPNAPFPEDD